MPDHRQHRGPHPQDRQLFAEDQWPRLRAATSDFSWLLTRGYAANSALKLVGDRHALVARQRVAVGRCACGAETVWARCVREVAPDALRNRELWVDGYNVLTSIEAALSGGAILQARDGCYRDMASMHGSYRQVEETTAAVQLLGQWLAEQQLSRCRWLLDQPVSNSGRLKTLLGRMADDAGWNWQVELVPDADPVLIQAEHIVATADSRVLDGARGWCNLARHVVDALVPDAWRVDLSAADTTAPAESPLPTSEQTPD